MNKCTQIVSRPNLAIAAAKLAADVPRICVHISLWH